MSEFRRVAPRPDGGEQATVEDIKENISSVCGEGDTFDNRDDIRELLATLLQIDDPSKVRTEFVENLMNVSFEDFANEYITTLPKI